MQKATQEPPADIHEAISEIGKPKTAGMDNGPRISTKDEELIFEYCNKSEVSQLMAILSDPNSKYNPNARDEQGTCEIKQHEYK